MAEEKQQLKTLLTRRMELRSFCMEDLSCTVQPERGYASGRIFGNHKYGGKPRNAGTVQQMFNDVGCL